MEGRPSAHKAWTVKLANDYLKRLVKDRAEMDDDEYDEDDSEEQTYEVNMILHEFRDLRARSVKRFRRWWNSRSTVDFRLMELVNYVSDTTHLRIVRLVLIIEKTD